MIYCYGPAGDVAHWRQELDGTSAQGRDRRAAAPARRKSAMHRQARLTALS